MGVFAADELQEIIRRALASRLHEEPRRFLLMGIEENVRDRLEEMRKPAAQLHSDLIELDDANRRAAPGSVPVARWLQNASFLRVDIDADQQFFRQKAEIAIEKSRARAVEAAARVLQWKLRTLSLQERIAAGELPRARG